MSSLDQLAGLLTAYRMATAAQDGPFSPIEAERQEQRAIQAAREIAELLSAANLHDLLAVPV